MKTFEIPQISFTKQDYNKEANEITINLNNFRWLDQLINSYQQTHRRLIPQIILVSPSKTTVSFA